MIKWEYIDGRREFICPCGVGHYAVWAPTGVHGCCPKQCCASGQFPGRKPQVGDLALCGAGTLGLITKADKVEVSYTDGNKALAWVGLHLTPVSGAVGAPWSSRNPCIVGSIMELSTDPKLEWIHQLWQMTRERPVLSWPVQRVTREPTQAEVDRVTDILLECMESMS